jgi:alkaline phosphatase
MITRRGFLRGGSSLALGAAAFPSIGRSAEQAVASKPGQKPRRIIHIVSDGMSAGTLTSADHLSQMLRGRGLTWLALHNHPGAQAGWMNTRSLNSLVTDSSAAASAWGSGVRIINGVVNQAGDGTPLKTLYELLGESGWQRGLVTTTEITHATPAGFAICVKSRDMATTIAKQYLERKVEVLLGGGQKYFDPKHRVDGRDMQAEFASAGYAVMEDKSQLEKAPIGQRWLGLFSRSHLPYTLDHSGDAKLQAKVPTLAAMTAAALRRLEGAAKFILQVEGGRVDHACHNNDAPAALHDQIALDEAIDVCVAFQKREPDTLILITTDHGNANLGLNGTGDGYGQSTWKFRNLKDAKASFAKMLRPLKRKLGEEPEEKEKDEIADKAREKAKSADEKERERIKKKKEEENVATPTEIIEIVAEGTGYKMPYRKAELLRAHLANVGESLYDMRKADVCALGDVLANHISIGFTGNAHTGDHVPVLALGPGAEKFAGYIQNVDIFGHYLDFAGLDFRNPQEPLITPGGPESAAVENISSYRYA